MNVLMVCTGNICRSVMAEAVLSQEIARILADQDSPYSEAEKEILKQVRVDSAGVSDEEHGNPPDHRAVAALEAAGYDAPSHRARQINVLDFADYDLLLAMTEGHKRCLQWMGMHAEAPLDKIRYYRDYDPESTSEDYEVPDPWYGGTADFTLVQEIISRTTPQIIDTIIGRK